MKLTTTTILAAMLLAAPACRKKGTTRIVDPGDESGSSDRSSIGRIDTEQRDREGATATVTADDGDSMPAFAAIYFEFDSSTLSAGSRDELEKLAAWLDSHPKARITIEGHTDDRGTDEYNVAL